MPNNPPAKSAEHVDGDKRKGLISDQPARAPAQAGEASAPSPWRGVFDVMFGRGRPNAR